MSKNCLRRHFFKLTFSNDIVFSVSTMTIQYFQKLFQDLPTIYKLYNKQIANDMIAVFQGITKTWIQVIYTRKSKHRSCVCQGQQTTQINILSHVNKVKFMPC